jgi:hypothetical protein
MAVKKHKLEMAINEDYCLLGVMSDEPDYRLCWIINRVIGTDFTRQDDQVLYHRKLESEQTFSVFSYRDEEALLTYRIIRNRVPEGFFLDELKNLDYLIHIQGEIDPDKIRQFMQQVAAIPEVRMCLPVELARIRNQERLQLW